MKKILAVCSLMVVGMVACGGDGVETGADEPVFGQLHHDPALSLERGQNAVSGTLRDDAVDVEFSSVETADGEFDVRIALNGMILSSHQSAGAQILDGVNDADGSPTLLTEVDQAAVRRLLAGLEAEFFPPIDHVRTKEEYDAIRHLTPAEERLFRIVDVEWSQWPTTKPLRFEIRGESERSYTSWRRYASTNTTVTGCHDCNVCAWSGDCCDTGKKLGEYFSGNNYGNCGTSDTGSQFTQDCTNHDQCVRTTKHGGHALTSAYCDDQFTSCIDDEASAPSCKYDWRGSSNKGNCPTSWNGDGSCDCFCQFQDSDC